MSTPMSISMSMTMEVMRQDTLTSTITKATGPRSQRRKILSAWRPRQRNRYLCLRGEKVILGIDYFFIHLLMSVFSFPIDWDGAADAKEKAAEARANGDFTKAVELFTKALSLGQVSAIALANRAECLLKLRRPLAAISDCDAAIGINPDSAKALR